MTRAASPLTGAASVPPTIAERAVVKLLDVARSAGLDATRLAGEAHLVLSDAPDPDARVPVVALNRLWQLVVDRAGRRDLPLVVAQRYTIGDYGVFGYACVNCSTLADGLRQLVRYARLWVDAPRFELAGGRISLRAPHGDGLGAWCAAEAGVAEILHIVRRVVHRGLVPDSVTFAHPAPADRAAHDAFFGRRVGFDAPATEMVFSTEQLALPVPGADEQLGDLMHGLASAAIERLGGTDADGFRGRVRAVLGAQLPRGVHDERNVARLLGVSERTLRRRLDEEGCSFRDLLDETRAGLARAYVRDARLPLAEVAFLLGFSDASSFHRAFRRWTGQTPAAFRAGEPG